MEEQYYELSKSQIISLQKSLKELEDALDDINDNDREEYNELEILSRVKCKLILDERNGISLDNFKLLTRKVRGLLDLTSYMYDANEYFLRENETLKNKILHIIGVTHNFDIEFGP